MSSTPVGRSATGGGFRPATLAARPGPGRGKLRHATREAGGVQSQPHRRRRALEPGARARRRPRDGRGRASRSAPFPNRCSAAIRPKTWCSGGRSSTPSGGPSSRSPPTPPTARPSTCWAWPCRCGALLFNAAAVVHRGRILGCVPKEKLPTYNVFYEARTFSRGGPGLALDAAGVPLGDFLFAVRLRHRGRRGVRRRLGAGRPDAPALPVGRRDHRERLGLALPHGHRRHAPRDAGHARRRQPDGARLRQRRGRAGRPHLRRRRLHLPERPAGARSAALRRPA